MKKILVTLMILMMSVCTASSQSFLNRIAKSAKNAAENAAVKKAEERAAAEAEKGINAAADAITNAAQRGNDAANEAVENSQGGQVVGSTSYDSPNNAGLAFDDWDIAAEDIALMNGAGAAGAAGASGAAAAAKPQNTRASAKYNKFDFVAGDEVMFEDMQVGEQLGEFPAQWDLVEGEAEIAEVDGQNVIAMKSGSIIAPLMKNKYNYLGDAYTIEFDYYQFMQNEEEDYGYFNLRITKADDDYLYGSSLFQLNFSNNYEKEYYHHPDYPSMSTTIYEYNWLTSGDDLRNGVNDKVDVSADNWVHISISFNKRALKVYCNETRIVNIPNVDNVSGWMNLEYNGAGDEFPAYIRNVRIAKGAVPLYDRMMSDGKFITYGITFDINKSTIKEESMGEINRIVKLMTDNPDLKFSVEGHTDATGTAAGNQKLSEARSKAIVDKLVELGISADRLSSVGKGQGSPIADNSSDAGRAKNRRVEFVKK